VRGGRQRTAAARRSVRATLTRELTVFLAAVCAGSVAGVAAGPLLGRWTDGRSAGLLTLALGTTLTGATHARLAHGQPVRALVPRVVVAVPLAYAVMAAVHALFTT
jgi:ABC-type uncharacterized transport system permease subunit